MSERVRILTVMLETREVKFEDYAARAVARMELVEQLWEVLKAR